LTRGTYYEIIYARKVRKRLLNITKAGRGTQWRMFPRTLGCRWLLLVPLGKTLFFVLVRDFQPAAV
jgi:hypothetical protein